MHLIEGDAYLIDAPRRYRSVFCPASTFTLFAEPGAGEAVLRSSFRALSPEGTVAVTTDVPETAAAETSGGWTVRRDVFDEDRGARLRLWERVSYDLDSQVASHELKNEVLVGGEVVESEEHVTDRRWWTPSQLAELLASAGFEEARVLDGYSERLATEASRMLTGIALRP